MADNEISTGYASKAIQGTAWRYLSFFISKLMVFISTIVLARILSKDDFGLVGYAVTAVNFLDIISDFGVGPALIYSSEKNKASATAFWLTLAMGFGIYGVAWFLSPFVGVFFNDMRVVPISRVLALSFPIAAFGNTHYILLSKDLAFGRSFMPGFLRAITKGGVSIILAFLGFGAWSLVWGQVGGSIISTVSVWFVNPWRPSFIFDTKTARSFLSYGASIVSVDLLSIILLNMDYLFVGKFLGTEALGVYTIGFRMPDLLILQFARIVGDVVFPIFTRMRDVAGSLGRAFSQTTRYVSLVTIPLGLGLIMVARPFTLIVLTSKWIDTVPVLQGITVYAIILSLVYNAGDAYKAEGRPQVITWLTLLQIALLFPALWWAVRLATSIVAVGWMQALVALICGAINMYVATRLLGLPLKEVGVALWPAVMASMWMCAATLTALFLTRNSAAWLQLGLGVSAGGVAYIGALWLGQRDTIIEGVNRIRSAMARSK
jgi:O-antigen/teichoic acid export membrane protein